MFAAFPMRFLRTSTIAIAAVAFAAFPAHAQTPPSAPKPAAQTAPAPPAMPDTTKLTLLIQNAMASLAQANMTGNYTVLHALSAPGFQKANPPQKLAELFASQRAAGVDILPVILFVPKLTAAPAMDNNGMLRLTGYYDTQPQNVLFDLLFVPHASAWRLFGISVNTRPAAPQQATAPAATAPPAEPAKAAGPPAKKK